MFRTEVHELLVIRIDLTGTHSRIYSATNNQYLLLKYPWLEIHTDSGFNLQPVTTRTYSQCIRSFAGKLEDVSKSPLSCPGAVFLEFWSNMHVCNPWNTHKRDGNRWICVSGTRTTFRKYLQLSWNILYLKQKCRMVLRSSNFVYDCLSLDFLAGILVGGCLLCTSYPFSKAVSSDPSFQQQIQSLYWRFSRFPSIIHGFPKSYRSFEAHSCAYFSIVSAP